MLPGGRASGPPLLFTPLYGRSCPRPVTIEETYEYGDARDEVLSCKPGITGWWAATDRNDSTWESGVRQARELFYVRHMSFGLDARVFLKTFKAMRKGI